MMRARSLLAIVSSVLLLGVAMASPASAAPPRGNDRNGFAVDTDADPGAALVDGDVVALQIDAGPGEPMTVLIPVDGMILTVDLAPYSVRAEGYQLLVRGADGVLEARQPGVERTLRGTVREVPGAVARASLLDDGLHGVIDLRDGSERIWVEPATALGMGVHGEHVIYRDGDVTAFGTCGTEAEPADEPASNEGGVAGGAGCTPYWVTELACDSDYEYYVDYGQSVSAVENQISSIINTMNNQYESQVEIRHVITAIIVNSNPADPYSNTTNHLTLLTEFRNYWLTNMGGVPRDVAELFTGRAIAGSTIGVAYAIGAICTANAYCLTENISGFSCRTDLSAHELGHLWGAIHCSCPANTMNPSLTCANEFTSNSAATIISHRMTRTCLVNDCIPDNDNCAGAIEITAGATPFSNLSATLDGPSETSCAGELGDLTVGSDIWFRFVSDCNGPVTASLCGADYDSKLAVYEGFCPVITNTAIACSDDDCGDDAELTFLASAGESYYLRVGGFEGDQGSGTLVLTTDGCEPPLGNDSCGAAAIVTEGDTAFTTIGASTDGPDEPGLCDDGGATLIENDVWFRWFSTCDGTATVDICDADFDVHMAVYGVLCPSSPGAALACASDGCPGGASITFPVSASTIYRFRVGGTAGSTGNGTLSLSCGPVDPPCPGDTNDDGAVDVTDLVNCVLDWGTDGSANGGDVDGSGFVDVEDLVQIVLAWGDCPA